MKNQKLNPEEEKNFEKYLSQKEQKKLIVHNDDENTFKDVIFLLVKFCNHNEIQAEQCALLVHHKGKCHVKSGTLEEMKDIKEKLTMNNLTVTIE